MYNLDQVCIEVTRRCNMNCAHCLRGEAQKIDINTNYIDELLKDVDFIGNITFTGGEPALNVGAIEYTLEFCKNNDISVGSFYIVTNAKLYPEKLAIAALKWYAYCEDREMCGLAVSKDMFHDWVKPDHIELLQGLSFFREDKYTDFKNVRIINEGRAKELSSAAFSKVEEDDRCDAFSFWECADETISVESMIYLSANGDIRTDCDIAYDNDNYTIGNIKDESLDVILQREMEKSRVIVY